MVRVALEQEMNVPFTIVACLAYLAVVFLIITAKSESDTTGFVVLPRNSDDTLSVVFHSLELLVFHAILLFHPRFLFDVPYIWIVWAGIVSAFILVILSFVFWRRARRLSKVGLLWGTPFVLFMTYTYIGEML
jgi:hypothetical protein